MLQLGRMSWVSGRGRSFCIGGLWIAARRRLASAPAVVSGHVGGLKKMNRHRLGLPGLTRACGVAALMLAVAVPVAAQSAQSVTTTDIQRLQDQVYEASRDLTRLGGNTDAMGRLQTELDDVRDEV